MIYQIDKGIKDYLVSYSGLPEKDVFISSTQWAFRNRIKYEGSLTFPFICFRLAPGGIKQPSSTYHQGFQMTGDAASSGVWEEYLRDRVNIYPYFAEYECIYWSNKFTNAAKIFETFYRSYNNENLFPYHFNINNVDEEFDAMMDFTNLQLDPTWNEDEELQKARLHSVDLSFRISAYDFQGKSVIPADQIIVETFYGDNFVDNPSPKNPTIINNPNI